MCLYCLYIYVSVFASTICCMCMYMHVYVCIDLYLSVLHICACICMYWYVSDCTCMYLHVCACMHILVVDQGFTKNPVILEVSGLKFSDQKKINAWIKRLWRSWSSNTCLLSHMSPYLPLSHRGFMKIQPKMVLL
jgi:hypothetical protein